MILRILLFLAFIVQQGLIAQDNLAISSIPEVLKENSNAVIRLEKTDIVISSKKSMVINKTRIVSILNSKGLDDMGAYEYLDNSTTVRSIEALIYNAAGEQIKKLKRKEFKEVSASGGAIASDSKRIYLDYTPVQYPFTLVFTSETSSSNTAFIPMWSPIEGLYSSTEKSIVTITHNPALGFKYKEYNFGSLPVNKQETSTTLTLSAENIPAFKNEDYSPSYIKTTPHVLFGLEKFHLEGVDGEAVSWESFGAWMYTNLLTGTDELPIETQNKIKALVGEEKDSLKKAKIVYEYVQSKTRYISIQLGIGGWKPMLAKDVDRLGYGDCKALTNYTRALLKTVGVEAFYAVIYGSRSKRDIREDFVSMQGNHVILAIPNNNRLVWLECTSQSAPFGYQANFTDDRMALLVKPEKGQLVRTGIYPTKDNTQMSKGAYTISENGAIAGNINIASKGIQYDNRSFLEARSKDEKDEFYKSAFGNINNLKLKKIELKNNKDDQEFVENVTLEAEGYCNKSGNKMMFVLNAFNQISSVPQRYRNRMNPFEISHGYFDTDEITIDLPAGFVMEAKPENVTISDKFGEYKTEYVVVTPSRIVYKRSLVMNEGYFESKEYENYRLFREKIARNDNAKIVLAKNN
ncbi:DUF3857 domain-containing protein [Flavobacterium cerinum]|uniref:DUF3857 domain-containing protein n=1 Tax=Flavobacterium cerinum TaxID=2502784 RepID=A0A3S3U321_9FLAO|nr:DUF3857 domain-containing protein [Flavobacterium cerinum]RWX03718.1 DUF3857 domain-containing protein [Flavobacterium cerinum]